MTVSKTVDTGSIPVEPVTHLAARWVDSISFKKVFPNEFSDGIEGVVLHPVRVDIV